MNAGRHGQPVWGMKLQGPDGGGGGKRRKDKPPLMMSTVAGGGAWRPAPPDRAQPGAEANISCGSGAAGLNRFRFSALANPTSWKSAILPSEYLLYLFSGINRNSCCVSRCLQYGIDGPLSKAARSLVRGVLENAGASFDSRKPTDSPSDQNNAVELCS